jgi:LAO/AO transport system kinase
MALELNGGALLHSTLNGDRRSLGKLISKIESGFRPDIPPTKTWTLGVTGPPGGGKSTLIGALTSEWLKNGEKVAILAVDPSSPKSGGALLGDRMRMQGFDSSESVYIRSIATRNHPGGLSYSIAPMVDLLSAAGWTRIIIETVGSGQSQIRIIAFTDRILLVEGPDMGDIIQAEKAGILELADIVAINKSDIPSSHATFNSIKYSLDMNENSNTDIHLVSAITGEGISSLIYSIEACQHTGINNILRTKERLLSAWDSRLLSHPSLNDILVELDEGIMTLEQAVDLICKLEH